MTQRLSKFLLAFEAVVLVAPMTFLFSMIASEMLRSTLRFKTGWPLELLTLAIIATSLAAGWLLMFEFWRRGSVGLRASSAIAWAMVSCGALATLVAVLCLATGSSSRVFPEAEHTLLALAWGLPMLVPFGHLLAERLLRSVGR